MNRIRCPRLLGFKRSDCLLDIPSTRIKKPHQLQDRLFHEQERLIEGNKLLTCED